MDKKEQLFWTLLLLGFVVVYVAFGVLGEVVFWGYGIIIILLLAAKCYTPVGPSR